MSNIESEEKEGGYITLKIWSKTKELFDLLKKQYHLNNTSLMHVMCEFFLKHKVSPLDTPEMLLKLEKKNIDRIIGFMRTQEMSFLKPIEQKVNLIVDQIKVELESKEEANKEEKDKIDPKDRLEQLNRRSKLRFAIDQTLEGLGKVKERKSLLGKSTLELEGMNFRELERIVKLLREIDPNVH